MAMSEAAARPPDTPGILTRLARGLALLGGVVMLAVATLVTVSVLLRWTTSRGVAGDFEWVQMGLALVAFSFLPLCQLNRGHIMVDTFTSRLPPSVNRALDALWDLVYAGLCGLIAWRLGVSAIETIGNKTTTMVLGLPVGWAIGAGALMTALLTVIAIATALGRRAS